jgi:nucleotide-binding universal stress UspA family protein
MPAVSPSRVVIVVAVDASAASEQVVSTAAALASPLAGSELHLLHVTEPSPPEVALALPAMMTATDLLAESRGLLDRLGAVAADRFKGPVHGHIASGAASEEIVQFASNLNADLIVVGTHGRKGVKRLVLGSVAELVVRNASCAVLVARPKVERADVAPAIEAPCPDCVEVQRASAGEKFWCERHSAHHAHGRLHYDHAQPTFGRGSQFVR